MNDQQDRVASAKMLATVLHLMKGTPWIEINENHSLINAAADKTDPDGIFQCYRRLIELRKQLPVIRRGSFSLIAREHPAILAYRRDHRGVRLWVVANFTAQAAVFKTGAGASIEGRDLFSGKHHRIDDA